MAPKTQLLTGAQVAAQLGIATQTWWKWRSIGRFEDLPPPVGFGARPRFKQSDVEAFIERHARKSTG